jgi:UDP-glucose 4-epimerase
MTILRYLNPVGADRSGLMCEDPKGSPSNLMLFSTQVAVGRREYPNQYGKDFAALDGPGIRDDIQVAGLALGHPITLGRLAKHAECKVLTVAAGTGPSVLSVVDAVAKACGLEVPYRLEPRRPGGTSADSRNSSKAKLWLNWEAKPNLASTYRESWRWQCENLLGYM